MPHLRRLRVLLVATMVCFSVQLAARASAGQLGAAELYWLMSRACYWGDDLAVRMLLAAGADPSGPKDYIQFRSRYKLGYEPSLHLVTAARRGHLLVVRQLLDSGAQANLVEGEGHTALSVAAREGHAEVVRLLLTFGADKSYQTPLGTAAQLADQAGHHDIARLIRAFPPASAKEPEPMVKRVVPAPVPKKR